VGAGGAHRGYVRGRGQSLRRLPTTRRHRRRKAAPAPAALGRSLRKNASLAKPTSDDENRDEQCFRFEPLGLNLFPSAMSAMLTIRDESAAGQLFHAFALEFPADVTTVRELIRARVEHEVMAFNARQGECVFNGLVQPTGAERVLNGFKLPERRAIDAKQQCDLALEAFERNAFLILVGEHQVERLDEEIVIRPGTDVSFVKLVPLVGG
jgi:hypothetical protein